MIIILLAFFLTVIFIKVSYKPAMVIGLIDIPDGRKNHLGEIPLTGGLAVFFAVCIAVIFQGNLFDQFPILFGSLFFVLTIGLLDDLYDLSTRSRLFAQIFAALMIVLPGQVYLSDLGDIIGFGNVNLNWLSIPFTVFCVVGIVNAINMIDGIDGLAGGVVFIALVLFGVAAGITGIDSCVTLIFILVSAVLAFIAFNMRFPWRKKAAVFLGDAGSTMLGLFLAWIAIYITNHHVSAGLSPIAAVWIVGVPVLDTLSLMSRRMLKGRSPFSADCEHIHHILLRSGFSYPQTLMLILSISLAMGLFGLGGWYIGMPEYIMFYAFVIAFIIYFTSIHYAWKTMKLIRIVHDKWNRK